LYDLCGPYNILLSTFFRFAAGAAGLNLMAANHCFLMDPAMNSAVEEQAIDR
jgi:SNF2 family DNA or RNA helicase